MGHGYDTRRAPQAWGALLPGQGRRVRWALAFFILLCFGPVLISLLSLFVGAVRVQAEGSTAIVAVVVGVVGALTGIALVIALLWARSQVVGDTIRHGGLGTFGWVLLLLGAVIIAAGVVGVFVAVFGLRGALDVLFGSVALAITGIFGLVSGAMLASVAARAFGSPANPGSGCPRCGSTPTPGARFCAHCGVPLG